MKASERMQASRAAKRAKGLRPLEIWTFATLKDTVKRLVADLNAKHGRKK